jgi:branched-chain amino acid aminotransferase
MSEAAGTAAATRLQELGDLKVYVNGELVPSAQATISVFDSGLNFADGVFEGVRVYGGRAFRLDHHVKRLYESANAFEIDIGMSAQEFRQVLLEWLRANHVEIESGPQTYWYVPGYYAVFFYDPDGLKLELVHVPAHAA